MCAPDSTSLALVLAATLIVAPAACGADDVHASTRIGASRRREPGRRRSARRRRPTARCARRSRSRTRRVARRAVHDRPLGVGAPISGPDGRSRRSRATARSSTAAASGAPTADLGRRRLPHGRRATASSLIGTGARDGPAGRRRASTTRAASRSRASRMTNFAARPSASGAPTRRGSPATGSGCAINGTTQRGQRRRGRASPAGRRTASLVDPAKRQPSSADRRAPTDDPAACDGYCNMIVNSGRRDRPRRDAGRAAPATRRRRARADALEGTTIAGNWIGVRDAGGHRRAEWHRRQASATRRRR